MTIDTLTQALDLPCGVRLPNRVVKAAMQECLSGSRYNYYPNEALNELYRQWAAGNFGLCLTGNVMINKKWLGDVGDVCVDLETLKNPAEMDAWKRYAKAACQNGTIAVVQINHPGRQSPKGAGTRPSSGEESRNIAPSEVPLNMGNGIITSRAPSLVFGTPKEMTIEDINRTVKEFINAAVVAKEAGFKGAELHGAHGYLVSSFNNPRTNRRTDAYGGSPESRMRFAMECLRGMRKACPAPFIIGIKVNSSDTLEGGLSEAEALQQIEMIAGDKEAAVDFIEISGGNYEKPDMMGEDIETTQVHETTFAPSRTSKREALFQHAATESRKRVKKIGSKCLILLTGGFKSRTGMSEAIEQGHADMVGIARVTALDPQFPATTLFNQKISDDNARYPSYKIPGKWFFDKLGLGSGVVSKWHVFQLWRISEKKSTLPRRSIFTFILGLIFTWKLIAQITAVSSLVGGYYLLR